MMRSDLEHLRLRISVHQWLTSLLVFHPRTELSTIASNLRTSSPDYHLTYYSHSTWSTGDPPAENLRTCYLSTLVIWDG